MLHDGVASLERIIDGLWNTKEERLCLGDNESGIDVKVRLKPHAVMSIEITFRSAPEIRLDGMPIAVYHSSVARLIPILSELQFLERHPEHASHDVLMGYAAMISNVHLMLGEGSLIRSEDGISEMLGRDDLVIVCAPIGECLVVTLHTVKPGKDNGNVLREKATQWREFVPEQCFWHRDRILEVVSSVSKRVPLSIQGPILRELRALQMLLRSIATNLACQEESENESR